LLKKHRKYAIKAQFPIKKFFIKGNFLIGKYA